MRISRIGAIAGGLVVSAALMLSGCASGTPTETPQGDPTAIITVNGSEPQNPLIPGNVNETGGGKIVDSIFAGLEYYDATGAPQLDSAESITTDDAQHYTITIKKGLKFTNGEDVTASSFVDAWNWAALASNATNSSYFFEDIEGFSYDEDSELTGLKVVDDHTFTIALKSKLADYPLRLGYSAFYPMPSVAFDDLEAYGQDPIGNGPYMLDGAGAWKHDESISLVVNPDYDGGRKAVNGGLKIVFYQTDTAAYSDLLSDNLDVIDTIPADSLANFKTDLGDRAIDQASAVFQSFVIPDRLAHFGGEEGKLRRAAISHAINRQEVTDVIFTGLRTPAHDFTSPVIDGYSEDVKGSDVLDFDADKAVELWAEADAISQWSGSFQIAYNADGGHEPWVTAVTNQIKNVLGIDATGAPYATFAEFRTAITDRSIQTAFRTGWQADYPGLFNFLGPIYGTNAGSNDGDYSNAEFDALLKSGSSADTTEDANADFQKAQEILFVDLPAIPLWYGTTQGGYSTLVENVAIDWHGVPLYYLITKGDAA